MSLDAQRPRVMSVEAAERIRERGCSKKAKYGMNHAKAYAQTLRDSSPEESRVHAYRCCFCSSWHLGHLMSIESMQDVAMAIRVLAQQ